MLTVTASQATDIIKACLQSYLVPLLVGSPGGGKSQIVYQLANKYKLKLIDFRLAQCDPTDLAGFPQIIGTKSDYVPMQHFPIKGDPVPEGYEGWLLFLDELTSAPPAIQAAAYKLILDRMVGSHHLHENVFIAGAGNLETDNAIVQSMSTALQSRLIHLEYRIDSEEWLDWAIRNGVDYFITDYIRFSPDKLFTFRPDHSDRTYACPRTWEMAHKLIKTFGSYQHPSILPALAGTLSEGVAREFLAYITIYDQLPKMQDILRDPEGITIPDEPSVLYALSGSISHNAKADNYDQVMKLIKRLPAEFQVVTLRDTIRRNNSMMNHSAIINWAETSAVKLF